MNVEELDQLLGATTWEAFANTAYGTIDIHCKGWLTYSIQFRAITGLYFGKPVQAITAMGHFVRMREFKCDPDDWELKELDPSQPGLLTCQRKYYTSAYPVGWPGNLVMSNHTLHHGILTT